MDCWLFVCLEEMVCDVMVVFESYDVCSGGCVLEGFVDDLSNWYVCCSCSCFWGEGGIVDIVVYVMLYEVLLVVL